MTENKKLIAWQKATNEIAKEFCAKYFETDDWSWVGCPEEIGGVLEVNGYYFTLDRIVEAIEINCSYKLFVQFYDYEMDCHYDKKLPKYNFKTWVKYFAGFSNGN
jgi:hypothetical protein